MVKGHSQGQIAHCGRSLTRIKDSWFLGQYPLTCLNKKESIWIELEHALTESWRQPTGWVQWNTIQFNENWKAVLFFQFVKCEMVMLNLWAFFFFFSDLRVLCDFCAVETVVWNDWWFVFLPQATTPSTLGSMCQRATGEGDVTRERQATEKRRKRRESPRTILTSQMWRMRMSPAAASWNLSVSSPWVAGASLCLPPMALGKTHLKILGQVDMGAAMLGC